MLPFFRPEDTDMDGFVYVDSDTSYGRERERKEYLRVIDFAKRSSQLLSDEKHPYTSSDIMRIANDDEFNHERFTALFIGFEQFLDRCFELKLDLMISGSSILHVSSVTEQLQLQKRWKPVDADIYMHATCDQQETLKTIDKNIREIYNDYQIRLFRTPYILTWFVIEKNRELNYSDILGVPEFRDVVIMSYQVILSPCLRWEHVFAGYHTDMVCAGYLTMHQKFVTTTRYDYWQNNLVSKGTYSKIWDLLYGNFGNSQSPQFYRSNSHIYDGSSYFFPDLVSPRYRKRVIEACEKYLNRGYACILVQPFDELFIPDIERSGDSYSVLKLLKEPCDIAMHINNLGVIERHGPTLPDVYQGETFATIIETMSFFRKCPGGCNSYVVGYATSKHGYFCEECIIKEEEKLKQLKQILDEYKGLTALVTGARCGLGQKMKELFEEHKWKTYGTTRFVNLTDGQTNMIELDLKTPESWSKTQNLLESGAIDVLVLSASETLHYPGDDNHPIRSRPDTKDTMSFDWTNDFQRLNTGVWHKTLDQHTNEEIISPLMANVAGTSRLLSSFLKGVKMVRSEESLNPTLKTKRSFTCIVVTSFEGKFVEKTPFHPITNACKSGLEQIVWTVQPQAKFLDCTVVPADPGWVYTESSWGKTKGHVSIEHGISQILQPLITALKQRIGFKIFRREMNDNVNSISVGDINQESKSIFLQLEPCRCIIQFDNNNIILDSKTSRPLRSKSFIMSCPECRTRLTSRNIYDFKSQITFVLIGKQHSLPKDLIHLILSIAGYPTRTHVVHGNKTQNNNKPQNKKIQTNNKMQNNNKAQTKQAQYGSQTQYSENSLMVILPMGDI